MVHLIEAFVAGGFCVAVGLVLAARNNKRIAAWIINTPLP